MLNIKFTVDRGQDSMSFSGLSKANVVTLVTFHTLRVDVVLIVVMYTKCLFSCSYSAVLNSVVSCQS